MIAKSKCARSRWGSSLLPIALALMVEATAAKAATVNVVVAGYFGGNSLSTGELLPAGSSADFGVFYSGSSFTSSSAIASALNSITTDSAMQSFRSANGWASLGTVSVPVGGDFTMMWDPTVPLDGPGFGAEFNLNPTTGALTGLDLVGKIPYVWIQTSGSTKEYGLFVSNRALIGPGFGALNQIDLSNTGDATTGVTALFGQVKADGSGIVTQSIPEPAAASLALLGMGLLSLFQKRKTTLKS